MTADPLNVDLLRRAYGLCTMAGCTGPGRHPISDGDGVDTGHRFCCLHLDGLTLHAAHGLADDGADPAEFMRVQVAAHRVECGHKVGVGVFATYTVERRERAAEAERNSTTTKGT